MTKGRFIVSLDFEKLWGSIDIDSYEEYKTNIYGVDEVLPKIVDLSDKYNIRLTVATVGLLMCKNKDDFNRYSPDKIPSYHNKALQPYGRYMHKNVGSSGEEDRLHFADDLITCIHSPHEIASHTFCHYYCNAEGQTKDEFRADLEAAVNIARDNGIILKSIVFPRNECRRDYLTICAELGFKYFRGNQHSWIHSEEIKLPLFINQFRRVLRLLDAYVPITMGYSYTADKLDDSALVDIRASRFLRPYNPMLRAFEKMKVSRILREMTYAAKHNEIYHLWWHPHNFGVNQDENLANLNKIYSHYEYLNKTYGFKSATFSDVGEEITSIKNKQ